ncbi:MAG: H4MPT-linked C1 transfer pathway protein [Proteobacteria bacterium]|nr:H4MPT-linked C1 transfer pathway protein [Pseudomonadota bacterium]
MPDRHMIGWDVGGAHLKACVLRHGRVVDVAEWACPLWQGLDRLDAALDAALARWPWAATVATHAATMTGEMVDLFDDREAGVARIAARLAGRLAGVTFYAGASGWCDAGEVAARWAAIASANWHATAQHAALQCDAAGGVLVDIGSTTTDLIAFRDGQVATTDGGDHERLASGALVYQGVVRTPLCALAPRIEWRGSSVNVMNELFATTADVYRLTGELAGAHDLQPAADGGAKDADATRRRLARMIGLDARDADAYAWLALARAWRAAQVAEIAGQLRRVVHDHGLERGVQVVAAGCGAFLVEDVVTAAVGRERPWRAFGYGRDVAAVAADAAGGDRTVIEAWCDVCAPAVAVAALLDREHG